MARIQFPPVARDGVAQGRRKGVQPGGERLGRRLPEMKKQHLSRAGLRVTGMVGNIRRGKDTEEQSMPVAVHTRSRTDTLPANISKDQRQRKPEPGVGGFS